MTPADSICASLIRDGLRVTGVSRLFGCRRYRSGERTVNDVEPGAGETCLLRDRCGS